VVHVQAGRWRRSRIAVLDHPGLRPTPARLRETVLNWARHHAGGSLQGLAVADVFAGTGALGLEMASQGAAPVWLVEQHPAVAAALQATCDRLKAGDEGVRVVLGDAIGWLTAHGSDLLDLVLMDPPFASTAHLGLQALKAASGVLKPQGAIYFEAAAPLDPSWGAACGLQLQRHARVGAVHGHWLVRISP
jgi:16S rRNA (guanine966-N2)-methyltransferase